MKDYSYQIGGSLTKISFMQKLSCFIENILLAQFSEDRIFIFVDEIDRMLSLDFPVDDFIVTTNELLIQNTTGLPSRFLE